MLRDTANLSRRFACAAALVALGACISSPEYELADERERDDATTHVSATATKDASAPTNAASSDGGGAPAPAPDGGSAAPTPTPAPDPTPPPPPPQPDDDDDDDEPKKPSDKGAPGRRHCGTVVCEGCASAESGDCRECERACDPGELCCKRGGPPRCKRAGDRC